MPKGTRTYWRLCNAEQCSVPQDGGDARGRAGRNVEFPCGASRECVSECQALHPARCVTLNPVLMHRPDKCRQRKAEVASRSRAKPNPTTSRNRSGPGLGLLPTWQQSQNRRSTWSEYIPDDSAMEPRYQTRIHTTAAFRQESPKPLGQLALMNTCLQFDQTPRTAWSYA